MIRSPVRDPLPDVVAIDEEALFREARRLRRRRWAIRAAILLTLIGVGAGVVALIAARGHARTPAGDSRAGVLPDGPVTSLQVAGALAVGPTGALYLADTRRHRVLVRLADGRFRVIAGTGVSGYSGDGGSALRAQLSTVSDLTFSPTGRLYLVDGGRIRMITPAGVIHTVAGDGRAARRIASGAPARSVALGTAAPNAGPSIGFAPNGTFYITTFDQILRLTAKDTLWPVRAVVTSGPFRGRLGGLGDIAIDARGDVDVSGVNGWAVWQVASGGRAHQVGSAAGARRSGGDASILERAPDGNVYAEDGPTILRVASRHLVPAFTLDTVHSEYFWPTYFAFGPHHEAYLDEIPGDSGFEAHQQLIAVHGAHVTLLWQQANRGHRDSFGPH